MLKSTWKSYFRKMYAISNTGAASAHTEFIWVQGHGAGRGS
jgi:hypothetical protein